MEEGSYDAQIAKFLLRREMSLRSSLPSSASSREKIARQGRAAAAP
jgi:hypothetical protein